MRNIMKFKLNQKQRNNIFIFLMLLWPVIHFIIFWVYINIDTIALTFQRFDVFSGEYVFYGLENYRSMIKNLQGYPSKTLQYALLNSFLFFPFNAVLLLPISIICAYILYKKVPGYAVFRIIFFLPSIISMVVLTMVFKFSFDSTIGFINPIIRALGLEKIIPANGWFASVNTAFPMILLYCLWAGIGYNVVLVTGAMARVPIEIIESTRLDGIGFFRELWSMHLPLISSTLGTLFILSITSVFTVFLQPMLLTGGLPDDRTYTIPYLVNEQVKGGYLTTAATLGVSFSIVGVPFVMGIRYLIAKYMPTYEY